MLVAEIREYATGLEKLYGNEYDHISLALKNIVKGDPR